MTMLFWREYIHQLPPAEQSRCENAVLAVKVTQPLGIESIDQFVSTYTPVLKTPYRSLAALVDLVVLPRDDEPGKIPEPPEPKHARTDATT
jgi:hypothetical protein